MIRFVINKKKYTQLKQLLHPTYLAHTWIYSYVVQCTCIGLIWLTYDLCGNVLVFLLDFLYTEKSSAFKILKTLWRVRNCFTQNIRYSRPHRPADLSLAEMKLFWFIKIILKKRSLFLTLAKYHHCICSATT